ncbi:hypothetical protein OK016_16980 [Vibrio chagasii]|nr:hypothetical protein [Vibrio chagasii]
MGPRNLITSVDVNAMQERHTVAEFIFRGAPLLGRKIEYEKNVIGTSTAKKIFSFTAEMAEFLVVRQRNGWSKLIRRRMAQWASMWVQVSCHLSVLKRGLLGSRFFRQRYTATVLRKTLT